MRTGFRKNVGLGFLRSERLKKDYEFFTNIKVVAEAFGKPYDTPLDITWEELEGDVLDRAVENLFNNLRNHEFGLEGIKSRVHWKEKYLVDLVAEVNVGEPIFDYIQKKVRGETKFYPLVRFEASGRGYKIRKGAVESGVSNISPLKEFDLEGIDPEAVGDVNNGVFDNTRFEDIEEAMLNDSGEEATECTLSTASIRGERPFANLNAHQQYGNKSYEI